MQDIIAKLQTELPLILEVDEIYKAKAIKKLLKTKNLILT